MDNQAKPTPEEFFSKHPPEIEALAMRARQLIFSAMPGAVEQVNVGYVMITYGTDPKLKNMVFYISAHEKHVKIGLFGSDLQDPAGLMEGTGKQLRHVKLKKPEDLDNPALRAL